MVNVISITIFKRHIPELSFGTWQNFCLPIEKTNNQSFGHNLRIHNTVKYSAMKNIIKYAYIEKS